MIMENILAKAKDAMSAKEKWIKKIKKDFSTNSIVEGFTCMPTNINSLKDVWNYDLIEDYERAINPRN